MMTKLSLSPRSNHATYRAERAHVIPPDHLPPSPIDIELKDRKSHDSDDMLTPISCKRPSHNLLSNIVPSTSTPSTEQSSRHSSKPFASFGFDTSVNTRTMGELILSLSAQNPTESLYDDDDDDDDLPYESNRLDYLCESTTSSLGICSPGASAYDR
jgi:hypothetical protein